MAEQRLFLSGNEAVAHGARLARPQVIAAYPITPQTVVVERLSEMVANGALSAEYVHVESEHSALSAMIGASAVGARTFTATSSQGLLYMAECLQYASGGRFPIVMMNANRALALPWSIYGDQQDSLAVLDCGWLQAYAENAQESLDLILQAYAVAEHPTVLTPFMVNLDGFVLTHTYELVTIPDQGTVEAFLPPFVTTNKMDLGAPTNMGFTATPEDYLEFKYLQYRAVCDALAAIVEVEERFARVFGRRYGGLAEGYRLDDAELVLVTLGSVAGTVRTVVDGLRDQGQRVGLLRLRYLRPFPAEAIRAATTGVRAVGVLEKAISFGYQGTVCTHVASVLADGTPSPPILNFVAGLGGRAISRHDIEGMFAALAVAATGAALERVQFVNLGATIHA